MYTLLYKFQSRDCYVITPGTRADLSERGNGIVYSWIQELGL